MTFTGRWQQTALVHVLLLGLVAASVLAAAALWFGGRETPGPTPFATLAEGTDDAWMIALWMRAPSEDLEGEPPSGWLRNGRDPERVIAMAYQVASSWAA